MDHTSNMLYGFSFAMLWEPWVITSNMFHDKPKGRTQPLPVKQVFLPTDCFDSDDFMAHKCAPGGRLKCPRTSDFLRPFLSEKMDPKPQN